MRPSFNEIVGPRSAEAGYLEAPVMVDDDLVPSIGGEIYRYRYPL